MAWVCCKKNGVEIIISNKPSRTDDSWVGGIRFVELPKGIIKKLIGKELSWYDEPVELKEE